MMKKDITCIVCPIGCKIIVKLDGTKVDLLSGNKCKQGIDYAINEALDPRRMLTTSVLVELGEWPLVSVKSSKPVQRESVFSILKEIKKTKLKAPVKTGQIIIKNVAGVSTDILTTKSVKKKS